MNILILFNEDRSYLKRLKYARLRMDDVFCDVIIVPYSHTEIENMRERKFNALYKRIYADCRYSCLFPNLPARLKKRFEEDGVNIAGGYSVNIKYIKEIIMKIGSYHSVIGIYSEKITPETRAVIYSLSEITNILYLFTHDIQNALDISEEIFEQSGTPVNVSPDILKIRNMNIAVAMDSIDFQLKRNTQLVDIFDKNSAGISGLYFSVPEKYREIQSLCGACIDSAYAEFLERLGADFSEIRISGIRSDL